MNEDKDTYESVKTRNRLLQEAFAEAMEEIYESEPQKASEQSVTSCGCIDNCGDRSMHTEDTVLEGILLDPDDQTYESSVLQDNIQAARRIKFANV